MERNTRKPASSAGLLNSFLCLSTAQSKMPSIQRPQGFYQQQSPKLYTRHTEQALGISLRGFLLP
jgi:hypothetical protein